MKKIKLLSLAAALLLCACSVIPPQGELPDQEEKLPAEPSYVFDVSVHSKQFTREDNGELYASYEYHCPMMRVTNLDELSEEDRAIAQRNLEAFNALMQQELDEALKFGEDMEKDVEGGYLPLADEKIVTVVRRGQILTVLEQGYYYGGGAHPFTYTATHTFDLELGQYIDPAQIGDDPEYFRKSAAPLLIAYAESLGEEYVEGFWSDYAEIISRWNEAAVVFDESGMTVTFSVYELGPYAMGPVQLHLTYDEIADAIGAGGLKRLGVTLESK